MKVKQKILSCLLVCGSAYAATASAGVWQKNMSFDNDASSWGGQVSQSGSAYVNTSPSFARSGSKYGYMYAFSGWAGIGRSITIPSGSVGKNCVAAIYTNGDASYLEVIDQATWTYLRPLAHSSGSSTYKQVNAGVWVAPRRNVYLRHVVPKSGSGSYSLARVDDSVMQCST